MWFSILGAPASSGDFWGNAVSVVLGQDPDISNFKLSRWFSGTKLNPIKRGKGLCKSTIKSQTKRKNKRHFMEEGTLSGS